MEQKSMQMIYFLLFNIVYLALGVTMLGYGIFSIQSMQLYGSFSENSFIAGACIFVAVGALKIVLSVVGFVATFKPKKALMALYVSVVVFLMFMTFIAAMYAFQARKPAWDATRVRLTDAYATGTNETADLLTVQNNLNCCGVDRMQEAIDAGRTCNSSLSLNLVYGQGCQQQLGLLFVEQLYSIGALGMTYGVFEATSILVAMQHMQA